ncbi:MAG: RNase adapter RapZ [Vulcanimicrobiaceae bacterium]
MKSFEDLGFHCVDRLPPRMAAELLDLCSRAGIERLALALDVGVGGPFGNALDALDELRAVNPTTELLFLEAGDEAIVRRYSETRRRHPFEQVGHLLDAIAAERQSLAPFRARADRIWDTTGFTHARLKAQIAAAFADEPSTARLAVHLLTFGFKHGLPADSDLVFDVRFLPNPNYEPELRELTGMDLRVAAFLESIPATTAFLARLYDMIDFLVPHYIDEGKARLTIAIGCTGGRHRSVYVAERLARHLQVRTELAVTLEHRDTETA